MELRTRCIEFFTKNASTSASRRVTTQVFWLKTEGYKTSRKAQPFKTFSVSTTFGSIRAESSTRST
jgi:hypothetical protein